MTKNAMKWLRLGVGYALAIGILFFLGRMLYQTWNDLAASEFRFEFDLWRLGASLVLLVVGRAFAVEAWRRILILLGESFSFAFGARVWFLSNLTRYVPGNIWQVATMMAMVEQCGVSKTNALLSQVIYTALALSIAGLLGLVFIFSQPDLLAGILPFQFAAYVPAMTALGFLAIIIGFALPVTNRCLVALTARFTRRELAASPPTFTRGLVPPLFSMLMWVTNGLAFFLFIAAITPTPVEQLPAFIAMNAGAYWIGYVSFVTPSGLGFRESALALMLATFFPTPVAVALSLVTRLWSTAGEILGVSLVWITPTRLFSILSGDKTQ
jgi:hypothetical protein